MLPRARAPRFSYLLAVAAGLSGVGFAGVLTKMADLNGAGYVGSRVGVTASFAVGHFVLGGAFGLLWPRAEWRWGVWLCAAPACYISFQGPGVWFFLGWVVLTMIPACLGAYAAGTAHLKFTAVDEEG